MPSKSLGRGYDPTLKWLGLFFTISKTFLHFDWYLLNFRLFSWFNINWNMPKRILCVSFGWTTEKSSSTEVFDTFLGNINLKCPQIKEYVVLLMLLFLQMCGFLNYSTWLQARLGLKQPVYIPNLIEHQWVEMKEITNYSNYTHKLFQTVSDWNFRKASWKMRGWGPGVWKTQGVEKHRVWKTQSVENMGCGKCWVCKTWGVVENAGYIKWLAVAQGNHYFAQLWIFVIKIRSRNFAVLNCNENQFMRKKTIQIFHGNSCCHCTFEVTAF